MIIDFVNRKATISAKDKRTDYIIEEIVRETKNPNVLNAVYNLKNKNKQDIYYNEHTDKAILTEEYNRILKKIKKMVLNSSTSITKPEKSRFFRLMQIVDVSLSDYEAMMEGLKHEKSGILHYLSNRTQVDKQVLETIKNENVYEKRIPKHSQRHNIIAAMHLKYYDHKDKEFISKLLNATRVVMLYETIDKNNFHNMPALKDFIESYPEESKQWIQDFAQLCKELKLKDCEKIISDTNELYQLQTERIKRDSIIDIKNNTTQYLLEQQIELLQKMKYNYSLYQLYRNIDNWMSRYYDLKKELESRDINIEKEVDER